MLDLRLIGSSSEMSEQAKVRLVRCPKCENLLPELKDYSVYQCGGCGAVLRAKKTNGEVVALSEKSDEERNGGALEGFSENSENINVSERRMRNLSDASEDDVKSNGSCFSRERRRSFNDGTEHCGTSSMARAGKWILKDNMGIDKNASGITSAMARAGKSILKDNKGIDKNTNGISYTKMEKEFENMNPQIGNALGLHRSAEVPDWRIRERSEIEGFRRAQRIGEVDEVGLGYSTQNYPGEGPLNYQLLGRYSYGDPLQKSNEIVGFDEVAYPGDDRAELLRKLDELKDQLSRSCNLVDRTKNNIPLDRRMAPQDPYGNSDKWFPEGYSPVSGASIPYSFPDKCAARPPYRNHYSEPSPSVDRHAMIGYGFYPPTHTLGHVHEFEDPLRTQMPRRHPHQASAPCQQKPSHVHFSGPYKDGNIVPVDSFESYPATINQHHPSCSCFHCYGLYQVPHQVPPYAYGDRRFSDGAKDLAFYHHENPKEYGPRDYSANISDHPSFQSHSSQSHTRWPSDLNSEVSDSVRSYPSRVLLANSGRRCRPIAGGAPFLACQNCYELLQLPKKVFSNSTKQKKIRCGACSSLILLVVDTKRLDVSVYAEAEANVINKNDHLSHNKNLSEGSSNAQVRPNRASLNFSSEDYDNSGYDFQSMDREVGPLSTSRGSLSKFGDVRNARSAYSSSFDDEENPENSPAVRKYSNSAELPVKEKPSPPPAGSPLQDYFDYSNKYHVVNRFGDGNRSGRSEQDKATLKKTTLRENSMKDASATEIEISSNEYANTGTSLDSGEVNKEGYQLRANKSNSNVEQGKANVTVNGNLIPDQLIKKAEKPVGRIHPGHYWYDFRAGFWGVMGGPCLGIIPPFIEEFNYPMPENCTGGKTGVFVNGRELHEKDLNLLGSRGLPTERDRSYIVEISGRVLDEDTGEELESLGKLAPTIERLKRGFGMKDPKATV